MLLYIKHPECNFVTFVTKQEEPPLKGGAGRVKGDFQARVPACSCRGLCDGRQAWEREGEIPSRDPITRNAMTDYELKDIDPDDFSDVLVKIENRIRSLTH